MKTMSKFDLSEYLDEKILKYVENVISSEGFSFSILLEASGLDPTRDLRFQDFSGVDFRNTDMRGFDLTGADLRLALRNDTTLIDDTTDLTDAKTNWLIGPSDEDMARVELSKEPTSLSSPKARQATNIQLEQWIRRAGNLRKLMDVFEHMDFFDRRLDGAIKDTVIRHLQNQLNWNSAVGEHDTERYDADVTEKLLFSSRHPLFFDLNMKFLQSYGGERFGDVLIQKKSPNESDLEKLSRLTATFKTS